MSLARNPKQYRGVRAILPPDLQLATRAPTSADKSYVKGTLWLDTANSTSYQWPGTGNWISLGAGAVGGVVTLTGNSGGAISPSAGNINVVGTGSITDVGSGSTLTMQLTGLTNHNVLLGAGTATITKVAPSATSGVALVSAGAAADPIFGTVAVAGGGTGLTTLTIHALYVGNGTSAPTALAVGATGQTLMGSTAADPGWTGSPSFSGSVTAATTVTATLGAITATNGNFVGTASGTGILLTQAQASGAAASPVVVNGRSGRATFTSVSIAAAADLTLTLTNSSITASTTAVLIDMSGATTGSALSIKSKTASSGSLAIVVTNGTGATTTTADIQIDFLVINA